MTGYIYVIRPARRPSGPYKIGFSRNPEKRLASLSAASPFPLELMAARLGTFAEERAIHRRFGRSYSHNEWYDATPEVYDFAQRFKDGSPLGECTDFDAYCGPLPYKPGPRARVSS